MARHYGTAVDDALGPFETNDEFYSGSGDDVLYGGGGNDYFRAGEYEWGARKPLQPVEFIGDDDVIHGGRGDDFVDVGNGTDANYGDEDNDTIRFARIHHYDDAGVYFGQFFWSSISVDLAAGVYSGVLTSRVYEDMEVRRHGTLFQFETILGTDGDDTISGDVFGERLEASTGANKVDGRAGADTLSGSGTLDGGSGDDIVTGAHDRDVGANLLRGGAGADTLIGGAGKDVMIGGSGVDDVADYSLQRGTQGVAVFLAGGSDSFDGFGELDMLREIEHVRGGALSDSITGSRAKNVLSGREGDDTISGEGAADKLYGGDGKDLLDGGDGDDALVGGRGKDTIRGGDGEDFVNFLEEAGTQGVLVRLGGGRTFDSFGDIDKISGVERVRGTDFDDVIYGDKSANTMSGQRGADTIIGLVGADSLYGSAGDDHLGGSFDDDLLAGQEDNDTLEGGPGRDRLFGGAGRDRLNGGDDKDVLHGDEGRDTLDGGGASDTIFGGDDADLIRDRAPGKTSLNVDEIKAGAGDHIDGGEGNDTIEAAGSLVGGAGADRITGIGVLDGGEGNDRLTAEAIDDLYGAFILIGGAGADTLVATNRFDLVIADYAYSGVGVSVDLRRGSATGAAGDRDRLVDIHAANGSMFGDTLTGAVDEGDNLFGDVGDDLIKGLGGDDILDGGGGDDTLDGGKGKDLLMGHDGADVLIGGDDTTIGEHNDQLRGGDGDDVIRLRGVALADGGDDDDLIICERDGRGAAVVGGAGRDTLVAEEGSWTFAGEEGVDHFVIRSGVTVGIIDFDAKTERIDVSAFGFASFRALMATASKNGEGNDILRLDRETELSISTPLASLAANDFIL